MDTTVFHLGQVVVAALRAAGYKDSTIDQYQKTIKTLNVFVAARGGTYTPELGAQFAALTTSPRTGSFSAQRRMAYSRLVAVFDSYLDSGTVLLATRKRGGGGRCPTTSEFRALDAGWEADMADRGLAAATCESYGRVARGYLVYLEDHETYALNDAGPATVTGFFSSLLDRWAQSSLVWQVSNFRPFLKFCGRADLVDALSLLGIRRRHTIAAVLTDQATERLVTACASPATVGARDAAVTLLALTTGLRACDIVALRLADIDWRAQVISLVQQKTKNPVQLPMPGVLTDRLAAYVLEDRPDSGDDHVFLRSLAPHIRLADHATIYRITAEVFAKAGIVDGKAGTRLLRHNAASRLLRAAVPLPTIAAVLGHASEESTNTYLSIDQQRLLDCVLPVPVGALS